MIKQLVTFSANGNNYTASSHDIFMHNGIIITFIKDGKYADPAGQRVYLSDKEFARIVNYLEELDYEKYYGRKLVMTGVRIYKTKEY